MEFLLRTVLVDRTLGISINQWLVGGLRWSFLQSNFVPRQVSTKNMPLEFFHATYQLNEQGNLLTKHPGWLSMSGYVFFTGLCVVVEFSFDLFFRNDCFVRLVQKMGSCVEYQGCRFAPYTCSETKPQMGHGSKYWFSRVWLWFRAKSTTLKLKKCNKLCFSVRNCTKMFASLGLVSFFPGPQNGMFLLQFSSIPPSASGV